MGYGEGIATIKTIYNQTSSSLVLWNQEDASDNTEIQSGVNYTTQGEYGTAIPVWDDDDIDSSFYDHHLCIGTELGLILMWQHQSGSIYYTINTFPSDNENGNTLPGDGAHINLAVNGQSDTLTLDVLYPVNAVTNDGDADFTCDYLDGEEKKSVTVSKQSFEIFSDTDTYLERFAKLKM